MSDITKTKSSMNSIGHDVKTMETYIEEIQECEDNMHDCIHRLSCLAVANPMEAFTPKDLKDMEYTYSMIRNEVNSSIEWLIENAVRRSNFEMVKDCPKKGNAIYLEETGYEKGTAESR